MVALGVLRSAAIDLTITAGLQKKAARPGFEPGSEEPKSSVLPLHHRAISELGAHYLRIGVLRSADIRLEADRGGSGEVRSPPWAHAD